MNKINAKIIARKEVAEATFEVTFKCEQADCSFEAGQYVEVTILKLMYPDSKGNIRDFSTISSPNDKGVVTIVFRLSDSGFKRTLIELPIGSEVVIRGPLGFFKLPKDTKKDIVFIAGGVGIAPFMSMIRYATEEKLGTNITLLYANSRPERATYVPELEALADQNPNFKLVSKLGYIDVEFIKDNVEKINKKLWYVSGPPVLVRTAVYLLKELKVKEEDIVLEEMSGYDRGIQTSDTKTLTTDKSTVKSEDVATILERGRDTLTNPILDVLSRSALVAVTDTQGTILYANDFFVKVSGYSKDELIGQNHRILKSTEHSQEFYKSLWDTITKGNVWRGEIKNRAKDGSIYWVDSSIAPIFGKNGKITHYVAVRFLITDEKTSEEELRNKTVALEATVKDMKDKEKDLEDIKKATLNILEDLDEEKKAVEKKVVDRTLDIEREKSKLLQVTSNMKGASVLFDNESSPVFVNDMFYKMFGVTKENTPFTSVCEVLFSYFRGSDIKGHLERLFAGETFKVPEIDADAKIYEMFCQCIRDKENTDRVAGYFILVFDITDAKLLERSKSELVAVASHQLRTPLTAMRGNVEMLIDESFGPMNDEQRELLGDIEVSTKRLISMVNDMLDITKIERGNLDMVFELVDVKGTVDSIVSDLEDYTKRREMTVTSSIPDGAVTFGDKSRVRQVLQNLIDNAIKYGKRPGGTLDISSRIVGDNIVVVLKDNGLGIPKAEQSKIFGRFYRASNTANSSSSGSGLGLYIVKSIVNQLGGNIRFESEEGVGTTFFVSLPVSEVEDVKEVKADNL